MESFLPVVQEAGWAPQTAWTLSIRENLLGLSQKLNPDSSAVQPYLRYSCYTLRYKKSNI
jgi:hypothetical protein